MKNLFITSFLLVAPLIAFAQLKVNSDGTACVGRTTSYLSATLCDYTPSLYDEDDELAYTVFVPEGTTQIVLPSTLSGDFEIRFETATYYYYGYISL